jgi:hypothetical protein
VKPAPLRGLGTLAVLEQAHGVTGLTPATLLSPFPTVMGMGSLLGSWCGGTGARAPGARWHRPAGVRALNAQCTGAGVCARGALERGGPCSRGSGPSSGAEPARGERTPSNGTEPPRGRRVPSSEAKPARRALREGHLGGQLRSFVSCTVRQGVFWFCCRF